MSPVVSYNVNGFLSDLDAQGLADLAIMMPAIVQRVARWHTAYNVLIHANKREKSGFLEYGVSIRDIDNKQIIFLGMIQRGIGQPIESHS